MAVRQQEETLEVERHDTTTIITGLVVGVLGAGGLGYGLLLAPAIGTGGPGLRAIGLFLGAPLMLFGLLTAALRSGVTIDRRSRVVTSWRGALGLRKADARPLQGFDRVLLTREQKGRAQGRYMAYLAAGTGEHVPLAVGYQKVARAARSPLQVADVVASFLRLNIYDETEGYMQVRSPGASQKRAAPPSSPIASERLERLLANPAISCSVEHGSFTFSTPATGFTRRVVFWFLLGAALAIGLVGFLSWACVMLARSGLSLESFLSVNFMETLEGALGLLAAAVACATVSLSALRSATLTSRLTVKDGVLSIDRAAFKLKQQVTIPTSAIKQIMIVSPFRHRPRSALDYIASGGRVILLKGGKSHEYCGHGLRGEKLSWLASVLRELIRPM